MTRKPQNVNPPLLIQLSLGVFLFFLAGGFHRIDAFTTRQFKPFLILFTPSSSPIEIGLYCMQSMPIYESTDLSEKLKNTSLI